MNVPFVSKSKEYASAPSRRASALSASAIGLIILHVAALAAMLAAPKWGVVLLAVVVAGVTAFTQPRLLVFATVGFIWVNEILADYLPGSQVTGWKDGLLLVALLVTIVRLARRRKSIIPQHVLALPVFVVALHFVMMCIFSDSAGQVILGLKNSAFYMAWFFILPDIIRTRRDARTMLIALFCTGVILGGYNLWRVQQPFTSFPPFRDGRLLSGSERAHWGGAAYVLPVGVILGMALAPCFQSWRRWLLYGAVMVALGGLLVAGARAQLAGLLLALGVLGVLDGRIRQVAGLLFVGFVVAGVLQSATRVNISKRAESAFNSQDVSRQAREDETTGLMIPFVLTHPLGAGTGSMSASYSQGGAITGGSSAVQGGMIHNNFLYVAIEIGWIGLLAWIWMLLVAIQSSYRSFRQARDPFVRALALGLCCVMLDYSFMHFFAPMLTAALIGFMIWMFLGLIAALPALEAEARAETESAQAAQPALVSGEV